MAFEYLNIKKSKKTLPPWHLILLYPNSLLQILDNS